MRPGWICMTLSPASASRSDALVASPSSSLRMAGSSAMRTPDGAL